MKEISQVVLWISKKAGYQISKRSRVSVFREKQGIRFQREAGYQISKRSRVLVFEEKEDIRFPRYLVSDDHFHKNENSEVRN